MSRSANWTVLEQDQTKVVLDDVGPWDRYMTITNDAENVVAAVLSKGLVKPGMRLYYRDSDGQVDELKIKNGAFAGFGPGPGRR